MKAYRVRDTVYIVIADAREIPYALELAARFPKARLVHYSDPIAAEVARIGEEVALEEQQLQQA